MLVTLLLQRPQAIVSIVQNTPGWVWGLLAALLVLGLSQVRARQVTLGRMVLMPVAMAVLSLWGTLSAFGESPGLPWVLLAWAVSASVPLVAIGSRPPPAGLRYDPHSRRFDVPGSWLPLALILGIFLVKYGVGIELALQPSLARDGGFALAVATAYGLFSGTFAGRALRQNRLALRPQGALAQA